ncbi:unnamed protein product [Symbiodinium sp. CCMP2592]|nr:unnamed protein product [Symbiodinium sp. CCMP2592]
MPRFARLACLLALLCPSDAEGLGPQDQAGAKSETKRGEGHGQSSVHGDGLAPVKLPAQPLLLPRAAAHRLERMCSSEPLTKSHAVESWVKQRFQLLGVPPKHSLPEEHRKLGEALAVLAAATPALGRLGPLLVTWTTGERSFVKQVLNLGLSIRRNVPHLEKRFVVVAMDRRAHKEVKDSGFQSVLHVKEAEADDLSDLIWKFRWHLLLVAVRYGLRLAVVDSDVVAFRDPFPLLGHDADMEIATEHFWPEKHLWKGWVRPEDDLSTGFIFVRPSPTLDTFLDAFLAANANQSLPGGLLRDPFDQRVFNKFVRGTAARCNPCVQGLFNDMVLQVSPGVAGRTSEDQLRLRVLDPREVVANGVNFFWRKAHLQGEKPTMPALAHANGVGPKEYFLQDRGAWYLDDLKERFGPAPRFFFYRHPSNLSLKEDFAHLAGALEVARTLGRRLILPNNMNCQNCPAFEAYGLNISLGGTCTVDYFAYMFRFYHVHSAEVVPAGTGVDPGFEALWGKPVKLAADADAAMSSRIEHPVVYFPGDVRELRDALLAKGTLRRNECSYHEWPHRFMACRDEAFVRHHGVPCQSSAGQSGCGAEGFVCCWSHHGRADRLEYYTDVPWDLPCDCGLTCPGVPSSNPGVRCCGNGSAQCTWAAEANPVPPAPTNPDKDLPFASSSVLESFAAGNLSAEQVLSICLAHRSVYFIVREPLDGVPEADCNALVSAYVIGRREWEAARRWWRFSLKLRRRDKSLSVSVASGEPDQLILNFGKVKHDEDQLGFLVQSIPELSKHLEKTTALRRELGRYLAGTRDRTALVQAAMAATDTTNRALHVPDGFQLSPENTEQTKRMLTVAARQFYESPVQSPMMQPAVHSNLLPSEVLVSISGLLRASTVWYHTLGGGIALEAQLRDGLHAAPFLELGLLLSEALGGLALTDIRARTYVDAKPFSNLGLECFAADVAAVLLLGPGNLTLRSVSDDSFPLCDVSEHGNMTSLLRMDRAQWSMRDSGVEAGGLALIRAGQWCEILMHPVAAGFAENPMLLFFHFGAGPETRRQVTREKPDKALMDELAKVRGDLRKIQDELHTSQIECKRLAASEKLARDQLEKTEELRSKAARQGSTAEDEIRTLRQALEEKEASLKELEESTQSKGAHSAAELKQRAAELTEAQKRVNDLTADLSKTKEELAAAHAQIKGLQDKLEEAAMPARSVPWRHVIGQCAMAGHELRSQGPQKPEVIVICGDGSQRRPSQAQKEASKTKVIDPAMDENLRKELVPPPSMGAGHGHRALDLRLTADLDSLAQLGTEDEQPAQPRALALKTIKLLCTILGLGAVLVVCLVTLGAARTSWRPLSPRNEALQQQAEPPSSELQLWKPPLWHKDWQGNDVKDSWDHFTMPTCDSGPEPGTMIKESAAEKMGAGGKHRKLRASNTTGHWVLAQLGFRFPRLCDGADDQNVSSSHRDVK